MMMRGGMLEGLRVTPNSSQYNIFLAAVTLPRRSAAIWRGRGHPR